MPRRDGITKRAKIESLRRVALFSGASGRELGLLADLAYERPVAAGAVLVREGDFESTFFVVLAGAVRVERAGERLATLGSGDFFGEMALVTRSARTATVTVTAPGSVLVLESADFRRALAEMPALAAKVLDEVGRRLVTQP